jgi:hypothetical protein
MFVPIEIDLEVVDALDMNWLEFVALHGFWSHRNPSPTHDELPLTEELHSLYTSRQLLVYTQFYPVQFPSFLQFFFSKDYILYHIPLRHPQSDSITLKAIYISQSARRTRRRVGEETLYKNSQQCKVKSIQLPMNIRKV